MGDMAKKTETAEQLLNRKLIQAEEIRVRIAKEQEFMECAEKYAREHDFAMRKARAASGLLHRLVNKDFFGDERDKYLAEAEVARSGALTCEPNAENRAVERITKFKKALAEPSK